MKQTSDIVTMNGKALTLAGNKVKVGDPAPDFEVLDNNLAAVHLSAFRGKTCVICSVPSLDTPVCDTQTRKFNEDATNMGTDMAILTISMDLPFAQKRWCAAAGIENVRTLSDHKDASFGNTFGVLIKELRLLARAVFVIDDQGTIRYIQIIKELTNEPNYQEALEALQQIRK